MKLRFLLLAMVIPGLILCFDVLEAAVDNSVEAPVIQRNHHLLSAGRGFVPPEMDLSYLTGENPNRTFKAMDTPAQWDWRSSGKVTSVKNQGACGSCYAFASIANIESKILIDISTTFDFSENNVKECNFYNTSCDGGNYFKVANFLSKYGVVLESCDSYVPSNVSCNSSCTYQGTLLEWNIICGDAVPATATLKDYIYNYGPVYTTLYAGDGDAWATEFDDYDGSYTLYYTGTEAPNHAVLIVGWDDDLEHAGGTGGWIVKNSWGTGWGGACGGSEGGYFTIAYGSASIGKYSSFMGDWMEYDPDGEIQYYDEGGWSSSRGYGTTSAWGMCKFDISTATYLTRVEFWTTDITTDVDVYVYDSFTDLTLCDLIASELDNSFAESGYHSVELDPAPEVSGGNTIYVAVKFTNSSYTFPVACDYLGSYETGTTYISQNGTGGSWVDLGSAVNEDIAIRLRTSAVVGVDDDVAGVPGSFILFQSYPNPFNSSTCIEYSLPAAAHVVINIYDLQGRKVETILDQKQEAGRRRITWNADYLPSGVYFYRVDTGRNAETRKMVLLK